MNDVPTVISRRGGEDEERRRRRRRTTTSRGGRKEGNKERGTKKPKKKPQRLKNDQNEILDRFISCCFFLLAIKGTVYHLVRLVNLASSVSENARGSGNEEKRTFTPQE